MARVSSYTDEIADRILEKIATSSLSMKSILQEDGMPAFSTFFKWLTDIPGFSDRYARAKEMQADYMIEEMIDISDDGSNDLMTITKGDQSYEMENKEVTNRSKLRVDTRKWIASKLKPKKYGDKLEIDNKNPTILISYDDWKKDLHGEETEIQ